MEFITVRDLRLRSAEVWDKLHGQQELVLTSNGRPMAILADVRDDNVEEILAALRRARAKTAVSRLQQAAAECNALSEVEIGAEIAQTRQERRSPTDG